MSTTGKNWKTWSSFQSPEVREIYAHMTDAERAEDPQRGADYLLWLGVTLVSPLAFALTYRTPAAIVNAAILVTIHVVCLPIWQKRQKRFLCSTAWARKQGFTPERVKMFAFKL